MDIEKVVEEVGLTKNESKVYVTLSRIGQATANQVADVSKIHRTNVYDIIERLIEKGLISYIFKSGTKYFRITDPEQLLLMLEEKKRQLEEVMPQLRIAEKLSPMESHAEVVEGVKAFCNILENFLVYKQDILCYGIPKNAPVLLKNFISGFHKRRISKKIVMKHIYNFNADERIKFLNTLPLTEARYLTENFDSQVSTNICGDEIVFAIWTEDVWCIRVKNKAIADSYKNYFDVLWEKAKV